jgi:hypothetical protein
MAQLMNWSTLAILVFFAILLIMSLSSWIKRGR